MVTKVLFIDTSALLKLYVREPGSGVMHWLCRSETRLRYGINYVVGPKVVEELEKKISEFVKSGQMSKQAGDSAILNFLIYRKSKFFREIENKLIANKKLEKNLQQIRKELSLKEEKDDGDAMHYQSIVNGLAYLLGGRSQPILVTSDKKFGNKVKRNGFLVINPEKDSENEIKRILA